MNYVAIYDRLIIRAKSRKLDSYTERHHVIPRCLGGSDDETNLVDLTAREHYVAHQLLVRIHPNNIGLIAACFLMCDNSNRRMTNRIYGWMRERFAERMKQQIGSKNSRYGSKWIHNFELKQSKTIKNHEPLPDGWLYGRKMSFPDLPICSMCNEHASSKLSKYCLSHKKEIQSNQGKENIKFIKDSARESYVGKKFITDGKIDKLHPKDSQPPDGWNWGRSTNKKSNR